MKQTRQSITKTVSLKPEVEFEVIKTVLLRERYLKRLQEKLKANGGKVDLGIIGAFDVLREATIEVVETIDMWEKTQVRITDMIRPALVFSCIMNATLFLRWT
jgi:predicted dinucleotide-utilizing enzyme